MRTLLTLLVVAVLIAGSEAALAENLRQDKDKTVPYEPDIARIDRHGHATLKLSPMFMEIHAVNEETLTNERDLLARVAASRDDAEVQSLVSRLERLETDRQLGILKIRLKYARLSGHHDLVFQLRREIVDLLRDQPGPLM